MYKRQKCAKDATIEYKTDLSELEFELNKIYCSECCFDIRMDKVTEKIVENVVEMYENVREDALNDAENEALSILSTTVQSMLLSILTDTPGDNKRKWLSDVEECDIEIMRD